VIEPFLLRNIVGANSQNPKQSPVRTLQKTQDWFKNLRESCSASAGPILDTLQGTVEQRLQFDAQKMAHAWLHRWIAFHAGISVTLGVLLVVHIYMSLRYM
jgi:epoxyqueuosine reductase QueG